MYRKIASVLVLGLVLVFFSQFGYADDPHKDYYGYAPYGSSNPTDYYDPNDYGHPYGYSYPYGYYQPALPRNYQWQINEEQIHKEQKQLHEEYNRGEDF
jgi:hypothetical protein